MNARICRLGSVALTAFAATILPVAPAMAVVSCIFSGATVTVTLSSDGDQAYIRRSGGAIEVNSTQCGTATVFNTDLIIVTTDNASDLDDSLVTISLSGGAFEPGLTPESTPNDEIEFQVTSGGGTDELRVVGTPGDDGITVGHGGGTPGINLNIIEQSPDDADVRFDVDTDLVTLRGAAGTDVLVGMGGNGTGSAYQSFLTIRGGGGPDQIVGGAGRDILIGDAGADTINGLAHDDAIYGGPDGDLVNAGQGNDSVIGHAGRDVLQGGPDDDHIVGGPGKDQLYGQGGFDTLSAQDGAPDVVNGGPPQSGDTCSFDASLDTVSGC